MSGGPLSPKRLASSPCHGIRCARVREVVAQHSYRESRSSRINRALSENGRRRSRRVHRSGKRRASRIVRVSAVRCKRVLVAALWAAGRGRETLVGALPGPRAARPRALTDGDDRPLARGTVCARVDAARPDRGAPVGGSRARSAPTSFGDWHSSETSSHTRSPSRHACPKALTIFGRTPAARMCCRGVWRHRRAQVSRVPNGMSAPARSRRSTGLPHFRSER
jgi:hypothetical protein